jgi:uncharacterized protein (DUF1330 family)
MTAYLIAHVTVKDSDQWQVYVDSVGATLEPFGAEVVFRGKRAAVLAGEHRYDTVAVLKFPDEAAINNWYHSEAYQALIPTRTRAADVVFVSYQT